MITAAVGLAILAAGPVAHATFPGRNAELVYLDMEGVSSDSPTVTQLVQVCDDGGHERDFLAGRWDTGPVAFSPDGRMVATGGILLAPASGKWERRLTRTPRRAADYEPVWSPKGGALAFSRVRYAPGVDGQGVSIRSTAVRVYEDGRGRFVARGFAPAWSVRDQIAFVRGERDFPATQVVHVATLRSGSVRRLVPGYAPVWAPDGRRLVFSHIPPEEPFGPDGEPVVEVVTIRPDGSGRRRLARGEGATWSPNGQWIAFRDPAGYVAVVSRSGGRPRRVARSTGPPLFSPDSRWLAYERHEVIYRVPVEGGSRRFVTEPSEELELLAWRAAPASATPC